MAKAKLSRDVIATEAMKMLDTEGEKSFSMRKLAARLGVDPMAIYHHLKNKSAVIEYVLQSMLSECTLPKPSGDWQKDCRNLCAELRILAKRHPGCFQLYETYEEWLPAEHRLHEAFHMVMLESGLSPRKSVQAVRVLLAYTESFAVDEISGWLEPENKTDLAQSLADGPYPVMISLLDEIGTRDADADFEFGLSVLLHGLKAQI